MMINAGILVLLFGLMFVGILCYQACNSHVDECNRFFCGTIGTILAVICIVASIVCFANPDNATVDCSKLIRFKSAPTASQQYNCLTRD